MPALVQAHTSGSGFVLAFRHKVESEESPLFFAFTYPYLLSDTSRRLSALELSLGNVCAGSCSVPVDTGTHASDGCGVERVTHSAVPTAPAAGVVSGIDRPRSTAAARRGAAPAHAHPSSPGSRAASLPRGAGRHLPPRLGTTSGGKPGVDLTHIAFGREVLTHSLEGRPIDVMWITSFPKPHAPVSQVASAVVGLFPHRVRAATQHGCCNGLPSTAQQLYTTAVTITGSPACDGVGIDKSQSKMAETGDLLLPMSIRNPLSGGLSGETSRTPQLGSAKSEMDMYDEAVHLSASGTARNTGVLSSMVGFAGGCSPLSDEGEAEDAEFGAESSGGVATGTAVRTDTSAAAGEGKGGASATTTDTATPVQGTHIASHQLPIASSSGGALVTHAPPSCLFQGKRVVIISGRVHPGETPGSFALDGMLDVLTRKDDPRSQELRRRFVFVVIPHLNPDGVVRGHWRMDTRGVNLNRCYVEPQLDAEPSVFALKVSHCVRVPHRLVSLRLCMQPRPPAAHACNTLTVPMCVQALVEQYKEQLFMYIDCHAHAGKRGCFLYGNMLDDFDEQVETLLYPRLVALHTPDMDVAACNFSEENMASTDGDGVRFPYTSRGCAAPRDHITSP